MKDKTKTSAADFGTEITVGIYIDDDEKTGAAALVISFAVAFALSLGSVMCFISAIFPDMPLLPVAAAAAAGSLVVLGSSLVPKVGVGIPLLFVFGEIVLIDRLKAAFACGMFYTVNTYLSTVHAKFRGTDYYDLSGYDIDYENAALIFLVMTTFALSVFIGMMVIMHTNIAGTFIFSFPPAELILYYGIIPGYFWAGLLIAGWVGVLASELAEFTVSWRESRVPVYRKSSTQSAFNAAFVMLAAFCAAALFTAFSGYSRPAELETAKYRISKYVREFSWDRFFNDLAVFDTSKKDVSGAVNHGKLGRTDEVTFKDETVLRVTLPRTFDNVYLRGFVGKDYTGNSWKEISGAEADELEELSRRFSTQDLCPAAMDGYSWMRYAYETDTKIPVVGMDIENIAANPDYMYLPYLLTPESASRIRYEDDRAVPSSERYTAEVYDVTWYDREHLLDNDGWFSQSVMLDSGSFSPDELSYRRFVYRNYLDIPETFTAAQQMYGDTPRSDIRSELESMKDWFAANCEYDLSAGKLPFGEDFAQYFLTGSRKGSCTHFATAAVLLCRYRGIPARYCEGYIIKSTDFDEFTDFGDKTTVDVTDMRAHAWIEVYLDGCGWVPYEMTPGYERYEGYIEQPETEMPEEGRPEPVEMTEPEPEIVTEGTTIVTEAPAEVTTAAVSENPAPVTGAKEGTGGEDGNGKKEKPGRKLDPRALIAVAVIFALFVLAAFRYYSAVTVRSRRFASKVPSVRAAEACRYFIRLCEYKKIYKGSMSYEDYAGYINEKLYEGRDGSAGLIIEAGLAAKFGNNSVSEETAQAAVLAAKDAAQRMYSQLGAAGKFVFRVVRCLI